MISRQHHALTVMEAELEVISNKNGIASKDSQDLFYEELYESTFPVVAAFIRQMNGAFDDAKDIFQDALVIYCERLAGDPLRIRTSPARYILGIAKHLWLRKFKDDKRKVSLDDFERTLCLPDDFYPEASLSRVLQYLEAAGTRCLAQLRHH